MARYLGYAKIDMKSFNIKIIANNSQWASWSQKMQAIKDFYGSILTLNISIEYTALKPEFAVYGQTAPGQQPIYFLNEAWYEANLLRTGADIVIFVVPPDDHLGLVTLFGCEMGNPKLEWETSVFGNENDHLYVSGQDKGNSITWYMIHELSHAFYAMVKKTDNTHLYFNQGMPGATWNPTMILKELIFPMDTSADLLWDTQQEAFHSVRVLCDNAGLSLAKTISVNGSLFAPKDIICACIYQESRFKTQAEGPVNHDGTHDWGICQFNDGKNAKGVPFWIGAGAYFSSVQEVLTNPTKSVNEMIAQYKLGHIGWWASYSTGAYEQWLAASSPLWGLKT